MRCLFFPTVSHGSILIAQNGEKVPPFVNVNMLMITGSDFVTEVKI